MEVSVERCQQMIDDVQGGEAQARSRLSLPVRPESPGDASAWRARRSSASCASSRPSFARQHRRPGAVAPEAGALRRRCADGRGHLRAAGHALPHRRGAGVEVVRSKARPNPSKFAEVDESMMWQMRSRAALIANCSTSYEAASTQPLPRACASAAGSSSIRRSAIPATGAGAATARRSPCPPATCSPPRWTTSPAASSRDRPSKVSGEEGLRDVKIMMAIYEAAKSGRAVSIKL